MVAEALAEPLPDASAVMMALPEPAPAGAVTRPAALTTASLASEELHVTALAVLPSDRLTTALNCTADT